MSEFRLKDFLFQVLVWMAVAGGALNFKELFGVPRALTASLLLTLFLGFVTVKMFAFFDPEQRFIAVGATISSALVLLLLATKFYVMDFQLRALHLVGIFLVPVIVSGLIHGWKKIN